MNSPTVLSARYGIPAKSLKRLFDGEGFAYDEDEFEIEKCHQKALTELGRKRLSPYVVAYALWCREVAGPDEIYVRFDNLVDVADAKGFSLRDAILEINPKNMERDRLPTAQHWLDRAAGDTFDRAAIERLANWCRLVLAGAPPFGVDYAYLAVRLLFTLPVEEMPNYPKRVQRAINLAVHYGFLDGCHSPTRDGTGRLYHRQKFDL